jgi:hypothetical protein
VVDVACHPGVCVYCKILGVKMKMKMKMKTYKVEVDSYDTIRWYNEAGQCHREDDLPAVEYADGTKVWYKNGKQHREDGPAIEFADGSKVWCINGQRLSETKFNARNNAVEVTVSQIEKILGHKVKIVKG